MSIFTNPLFNDSAVNDSAKILLQAIHAFIVLETSGSMRGRFLAESFTAESFFGEWESLEVGTGASLFRRNSDFVADPGAVGGGDLGGVQGDNFWDFVRV